MPRRHLRLRAADGARAARRLRQDPGELRLPEGFPPAVEAEAQAAAAALALRPDDVTDLPFLTIDPPGSMDLDQAMHIERRDGGYRVRYAIADVASFVAPGGAIDVEARLRGETLYSPDTRTPLHPPVAVRGCRLPAARASCAGRCCGPSISTAAARNARSTYAVPWCARSTGSTTPVPRPRSTRGTRRRAAAAARRGGRAAQEAGGRARRHQPADPRAGDRRGRQATSGWRYRVPLPVESWNEQISLLTGMAAADLMLHAEIGVLRTLPTSPIEEIHKLRRAARVLDVALAGTTGLRRDDPRARPDEPAARGAARGRDDAAPRCGLHRVRRRRARAGDARRRGRALRPRDRAVAAPGRPVRRRGVRLGVRGRGGARLGARRVARAAGRGWRTATAGPASSSASASRSWRPSCSRDSVGQTFDAAVIDVNNKGGGTVQLAEPAVRAELRRRPAARRGGAGAPAQGRRRDAVGALRAGLIDRVPCSARRTSRPGGRVERLSSRSPRKVRAPQGKVVGNAHPG